MQDSSAATWAGENGQVVFLSDQRKLDNFPRQSYKLGWGFIIVLSLYHK